MTEQILGQKSYIKEELGILNCRNFDQNEQQKLKDIIEILRKNAIDFSSSLSILKNTLTDKNFQESIISYLHKKMNHDPIFSESINLGINIAVISSNKFIIPSLRLRETVLDDVCRIAINLKIQKIDQPSSYQLLSRLCISDDIPAAAGKFAKIELYCREFSPLIREIITKSMQDCFNDLDKLDSFYKYLAEIEKSITSKEQTEIASALLALRLCYKKEFEKNELESIIHIAIKYGSLSFGGDYEIRKSKSILKLVNRIMFDFDSKEIWEWALILFKIDRLDEKTNSYANSFPQVKRLINAQLRDLHIANNNTIEVYEEAKNIIDELNIQPTIELLINFSYGIQVIGAEKTKKLASELGIRYFARHSYGLLIDTYENYFENQNSKKPLLFVCQSYADHNGAFYFHNKNSLQKGYRLIITESETDEGLYSLIKKVGTKIGKIDTAFLSAHGQPKLMQYGDKSNEKAYLDTSDEVELKEVVKYFVENPTFILDSCSTGFNEKAIAALISHIFNARVFAPEESTYSETFILDEQNLIKDVKYPNDKKKNTRNLFLKGTPKKMERPEM